MTTSHISIGRQLLVAMISNDEPEFVRILDAACLQIRGARIEPQAEIDRVIEEFRDAEITLGLDHDLASRKMLVSEMKDRLLQNEEVLLAA